MFVFGTHAHKKEREKNLSEHQVSTPSQSNKLITPQSDVNLVILDCDDPDKGHLSGKIGFYQIIFTGYALKLASLVINRQIVLYSLRYNNSIKRVFVK